MTDGRRTILVVDDEPDTVAYLTTLFEDNGYATRTAHNGAEAVRQVRAERPDLVTLDVSMPGQSGVRAYRELKGDPALAGVPVLILTGVSEDFRGFISTREKVPPPEGYLAKPIDEILLLEMVVRLIG